MSSTNLPLNVFKAPEHLQSWRETMFSDTGQHISVISSKDSTTYVFFFFFYGIPIIVLKALLLKSATSF